MKLFGTFRAPAGRIDFVKVRQSPCSGRNNRPILCRRLRGRLSRGVDKFYSYRAGNFAQAPLLLFRQDKMSMVWNMLLPRREK